MKTVLSCIMFLGMCTGSAMEIMVPEHEGTPAGSYVMPVELVMHIGRHVALLPARPLWHKDPVTSMPEALESIKTMQLLCRAGDASIQDATTTRIFVKAAHKRFNLYKFQVAAHMPTLGAKAWCQQRVQKLRARAQGAWMWLDQIPPPDFDTFPTLWGEKNLFFWWAHYSLDRCLNFSKHKMKADNMTEEDIKKRFQCFLHERKKPSSGSGPLGGWDDKKRDRMIGLLDCLVYDTPAVLKAILKDRPLSMPRMESVAGIPATIFPSLTACIHVFAIQQIAGQRCDACRNHFKPYEFFGYEDPGSIQEVFPRDTLDRIHYFRTFTDESQICMCEWYRRISSMT